MSLDVYLNRKVYLSYDKGVTYIENNKQVYWANITHNLGKMADEADLYNALWRPHRLKEGYSIHEDNHNEEYEFEAVQITKASELIPFLEKGLQKLKENPEHFKKFNSPNGWGSYDGLVSFTEKYLEACREFPESIVEVCR